MQKSPTTIGRIDQQKFERRPVRHPLAEIEHSMGVRIHEAGMHQKARRIDALSCGRRIEPGIADLNDAAIGDEYVLERGGSRFEVQ